MNKFLLALCLFAVPVNGCSYVQAKEEEEKSSPHFVYCQHDYRETLTVGNAREVLFYDPNILKIYVGNSFVVRLLEIGESCEIISNDDAVQQLKDTNNNDNGSPTSPGNLHFRKRNGIRLF